MYAEITAALASLKSLAEIAKLTSDVKTAAQVTQKTAELWATILTMQEKMTALHSDKDALLQEKKHLEQKIAEFQKWEADSEHYELKEIVAGVFAYVLKPDCGIAEPAHWLCAHCYQLKHKSILQRGARTTRGTIYLCPNCKTEIVDHSNCTSSRPAVGGKRPSFEVR